MKQQYPVTNNTKITRLPKRGVYDKDTVYAILDDALFCTIAYVREQLPFQIPTGFCRIENKIYIHGSVGSFYMRELATHQPTVCVSVTHIDGLVLARSAFHHSVNYRSVVMFGRPERVDDLEQQNHILEIFTNKMQPGRWDDIRKPNAGEWRQTMVLAINIDEASAKIRTGNPNDDDEDMDLDIWAGVVPLQLTRLQPITDPKLKEGIRVPEYLVSDHL